MCRSTYEHALVQGLLRMTKDYYKEPVKVVRLWVHECERVLADRMINDTDMTKFNEFRVTVTKKYFDDVNQVNTGSLHSLAVLRYCCNQPCLCSHCLCCKHAGFSQFLKLPACRSLSAQDLLQPNTTCIAVVLNASLDHHLCG